MVSFNIGDSVALDDVAGRINYVDAIDGGFIGYNHGRGRKIEVLSEAAMEKNIPVDINPSAAVDYVTVHEALHDYASDEDPWEHAAMDVWGLGLLEEAGNYEAVRAGVRLHQERIKNARGSDKKFSEYALGMLAGNYNLVGNDGGDELSFAGYGSGGGAPAAGGKDKSFLDTLKEIYRSIFKDIATMYKPLDKPG